MNLSPELNDLLNKCKQLGEPIVITKDGRPELVVMPFDAYQRREDLLKLKERLIEAELEGKYYTLEDVHSHSFFLFN